MTDDTPSSSRDSGGAHAPPRDADGPRGSAGYSPRPFTAWATAHEGRTEPSLWSRARSRLARLFRREPAEASDESLAPEVASSNGAAAHTDAVAVPEHFRFPWTQEEVETEPVKWPAADDTGRRTPASESAKLSLDELLAEPPVRVPPVEPRQESAPEAFATVEEALPSEVDSPAPEQLSADYFSAITEADTDPVLEPVTAPIEESAVKTQEVPRPAGLMARLFGMKAGAEPGTTTSELPSEELNPIFLVSKFRAFYNEILHQKHHGSSDITAGFATAIVSQEEAAAAGTDAAGGEQAAQALSARLHQMLELQLAEAKWMGGETAARYPDAQYAMAVLADETLSTIDWPGRAAWAQHALEMKLYKSNGADLEFFRRVDRLFKEGGPTPVSRDLARVYLLTLACGFRGKYGQFGLNRPLHEYRQRLYEYIHGGDALLLFGDERRLFTQAEAHTIAGKAVPRLSSVQRWVAVLVLVVVGYGVIAHVAWRRASADLRDVTARIETAATDTLRPVAGEGGP